MEEHGVALRRGSRRDAQAPDTEGRASRAAAEEIAMAKRGDRVSPPAKAGEWELVFGNSDAANGWEDLVRQAPGPTRDAFDAIAKDPRDTARLGRQHRLRGALATVIVAGEPLEQWQ